MEKTIPGETQGGSDPSSAKRETYPVARTVFLGWAAAVAYRDYLYGADQVLPTGELDLAF